MVFNSAKRFAGRVHNKIRKAAFLFGIRPIDVEPRRIGGGTTYKRYFLTPGIGKNGKRLALKNPHKNPEAEKAMRKEIMGFHEGINTEHYTLRLSKKYPNMLEMRAEQHYDAPSLSEMFDAGPGYVDIGGKKLRQPMIDFCLRHSISPVEASRMAATAFTELEKNMETLRERLAKSGNSMNFDFDLEQFMVTGIEEKKGKKRLILTLIDI